MELVVNGRPVRVAEDCTLERLIAELGLSGRLAVEVNEAIVPRGEYANHRLRAGDRVEVVRAIGGG